MKEIKPPASPLDGSGNKSVQKALDVIEKNWTFKKERDDINSMIQELFEMGFSVSHPTGPQKISSKKLYQALWRMASRMKPLDFTIHGTQRPRIIEKIMTDGVSTVMDKGGYISSLRDKGGSFFKLLLFGDAFCSVGANPGPGTPIIFNPISNTNLYVDQWATGIRSQGWGRNATKAVAIFSYSWDEFVSLYPKYTKKAGLGKIPRGDERELERDKLKDMEDLIEVAHFYDINSKTYTIFAGGSCSVLEEWSGNDYPFIIEGKPYIPILHWMCFPSSEGFYNYGIGNMIYDLAIVSRQMLNMEIGHVEDNTYPVEIVNVPKGEASKFFNRLSVAYEMRSHGKKAFVPMEYDPENPNGVSSKTLLTQNLFNEWQNIFDRLDNELKRMGINLDELSRGSDVTATQILAEEESQNALIKQIMEYNASESKFAVELTMDFISEFISTRSKEPVNLTTNIPTAMGMQRADMVTMGMISEELKKGNYFVRVNSRSGAYPSNVYRQAQIIRGLQVAAVGSKAREKLLDEYARVFDIDIPGSEFIPQMGPEQTFGGVTEEIPENTIPSETDRVTFNANSPQNVAI